MTEKTEDSKISKTKIIPLSEPMGGDSSCCIHDRQCKDIVESIENQDIRFRCPLTVEVKISVEFVEHHDFCFENGVVE